MYRIPIRIRTSKIVRNPTQLFSVLQQLLRLLSSVASQAILLVTKCSSHKCQQLTKILKINIIQYSQNHSNGSILGLKYCQEALKVNQTAGLGKKALPHVPDSQKPESCCFFRNVNPISHTAVKIGIHRCSPRRGKIRTVALCEIGFIYFHDLKKTFFSNRKKHFMCKKSLLLILFSN